MIQIFLILPDLCDLASPPTATFDNLCQIDSSLPWYTFDLQLIPESPVNTGHIFLQSTEAF